MRTLEIPKDFMFPNVATELSPNDTMFDSAEHYLSVGLSAVKLFNHAIAKGYISEAAIRSILDLPCAHGRVARVLRARFPHVQLTVCDIQKDCVEFCAKSFEATPAYSNKDFDSLDLGKTFDLIWVGSLITHLRAGDTMKFFHFMARHLAPGGIMIVSSGGKFLVERIAAGIQSYAVKRNDVIKLLNDYYTLGYSFTEYHDSDVGMDSYGVSLIAKDWIENFVPQTGLSILEFAPAAHDGVLDVTFLQKK